MSADIDPQTGLPWGETADGIDHNAEHAVADSCPFDSCAGCGGYHCSWFCPEVSGGAK